MYDDDFEEEYNGQTKFREWFVENVIKVGNSNRFGLIELVPSDRSSDGYDSTLRELYEHAKTPKPNAVQNYVKQLNNYDRISIIKQIYDDLDYVPETESLVFRSDSAYALRFCILFLELEDYKIVVDENNPEGSFDQLNYFIARILDIIANPDADVFTCFPLDTNPRQ